MEKLDIVLVVLNRKFLEHAIQNLNFDKVNLATIIMDGDEKAFKVGNVQIPVSSFANVPKLIRNYKKFTWLIVGYEYGISDVANVKKLLLTLNLPESKIINFELTEQINPVWLANLRYIEEHGADFFATGDDFVQSGLDFNLFKAFSKSGVNLADAYQDLRQSFLTAKHVFAHVAPNTIKFVLIGLSPDSFCYDNNKDFPHCTKNFQYVTALNAEPNFHDNILKNLVSESFKSIFAANSAQADLNFDAIRKKLDNNFSIKGAMTWDDDAKILPTDLLESNVQILKDYIALCHDNGANPIGIILPFAPIARKNYDAEFLSKFSEIIHIFEENYGFKCIDCFNQLDYDCFCDAKHLNSTGISLINATISKKFIDELNNSAVDEPKNNFTLAKPVFEEFDVESFLNESNNDNEPKEISKMTKVITYGTFDLFHEGHYRLLQRAKALGDYLIVGVTTESFDKNRGKLGVIDSLITRIENVKKSGFADEIIVEEYVGQKVIDVQRHNVDIFAIGSDWVGKFDYLNEYCKVVYLERTKNVSSTDLRKEKYHVQRVGIIGNGRIANRFVVEAKFVSGANVQNIYNPRRESAERFAKKWEITPFDDLEKFFDASDLVYIASPHQTHYNYIKTALEHKKHVLCEKPMVLEKAQAEELFDYAQKNNLILFEGIKTAYCTGFNKILGLARRGNIGAVRNIEACFTKLEDPTHRELTDLNFGGSFLELGSYVILPILKIFGTNFDSIRFETINAENGLDIFTKVSLSYPNGVATATCGLGVKSEGRLLISGTKGYIVVAPPWWKTTNFEIHYEDPNIVDKYNESFYGDGLRYELSDMLFLINGIEESPFKLTAKESIALADIMERFRASRQ